MRHADSKKRRYMECFEKAIESLQRGEPVLVTMGDTSLGEWETARTYWYQWRRMQQVFNPEALWLSQVTVRMAQLEGQIGLELRPNRHYLSAKPVHIPGKMEKPHTIEQLPNVVKQFDGRVFVSRVEYVEPPAAEEAAARQAQVDHIIERMQRWTNWMLEQGLTPRNEPDGTFYLEWDSPDAKEYRARKARPQPAASAALPEQQKEGST